MYLLIYLHEALVTTLHLLQRSTAIGFVPTTLNAFLQTVKLSVQLQL